jgi:hypothetical protein
VKCAKIPAQSPDCNRHAERFVETIKYECLNHFVFFGERHLRYVIKEFVAHYAAMISWTPRGSPGLVHRHRRDGIPQIGSRAGNGQPHVRGGGILGEHRDVQRVGAGRHGRRHKQQVVVRVGPR